ncbi:hypothetical protein N836_27650 [Leptolyngbya sp. Heron Island J]|uniref:hypothetical protein n=1 Tax=Leptolyngbya sp. Heron Island J TaxID=1385935 RepID=UPI0003B9DB0D|nr:hypothetical protein [Leptolyngbya sp. Heron Island J]ESA32369.1 hypothetical protein N836_27650 [Leptolyngbya sp. Heron Island J]
MQTLSSQPVQRSNQPGPITWKAVPDFIQRALTTEGCTLLKYQRKRPKLAHIRFQYVPLEYQGDLYYLQRWSHHEWGVSPSQIIFPTEGPCSLENLSNGNLLSLVVKRAVASFYGQFQDNSPLQPSPSNRRHAGKSLPLAG